MQSNTFDDIDLKEVWAMIIEKMDKEGEELCPNSSSFYKTQDGIAVSYTHLTLPTKRIV